MRAALKSWQRWKEKSSPAAFSTAATKHRHRRRNSLISRWPLVVCAAIENSSRFLLLNPAPLFEEKRHTSSCALIANRFDPPALHRARAVTAFTADNDP